MATTQSDRQNISGNSAVKTPCKAATTANISLSGEQTIDGVSCVADDRVLVKDQTTGSQNGIYVVSTGTWSRSADWDGVYDVRKGTMVYVHSGSDNTGFWYVSTSDTITIGTTSVAIARASTILATLSTFFQTLVDDADTRAFFTTLGIAATKAASPASHPVNFSLDPSTASNALTMAVKGEDGNDPSATNPVYIPFRSATATSGLPVWRTLSSALSFTISSGSTFGHTSATKEYIYWYLLDNAGTIELAASTRFFGHHGIVSTTAEGGAGAADSGDVMYSATARTSVAFICVGYTEDTQTTAGTWATDPSTVHLAPFSTPPWVTQATKNSGSVTIGSLATIISLDLGRMAAGDLVFIDSFSLLTKGATAGDTLLMVRNEGTASLLHAMDTVDLQDRRYVPASTNTQIWLTGIGRVVTAGTVILHLKASSAGSDSSTGVSQSQIRVYRINDKWLT